MRRIACSQYSGEAFAKMLTIKIMISQNGAKQTKQRTNKDIGQSSAKTITETRLDLLTRFVPCSLCVFGHSNTPASQEIQSNL